ncbi:MAG: dTDP-4-dehydrorhamnose reductase [Armatimonadota bacterium]|nr:dTDP-4-dehydrorhamnose reductase [Armatimonadota bacterium]
MRVLVTGARGMVGRLVCSALSRQHTVLGTDVAEGCEHLDISDTNRVFEVFEEFKPETVIHCAAMTDVDGCERDPDRAYLVNAIGTWNLACACASAECPIIYVSTDYVFDGEKTSPYTEFDNPNPINVYGASKLAGEEAVKDLCAKHFIVRTSWIVAPHGKNFALTILNLAQKRIAEGAADKPLTVVADQIGSPTHARDLAEFLSSLVGSKLYGTYHFTNSGSCSWFEFASTVLEYAGIKQVKVVPIKSEEWPTPTRRPKYSVLRHYRLELLGRDNVRNWKEAVRELISEWTTARQ